MLFFRGKYALFSRMGQVRLFVGSKKNQRWTWYIVERKSGIIIAWENGRRKDEVFESLLISVEHTPISFCFTDDWGAYQRLLLYQHRQIIGKDNTWKIERKNLSFRTHIKRLNRKIICFSKNEQIHDNVIGMYIERFYYKYGNIQVILKTKSRFLIYYHRFYMSF